MYYGWADIAFASSASSTKDGGYVITGGAWQSHCCDYSYYAYLLKVNNAGNPQWIKKYEVEGSEVIGRALASTKDGGAIITGDYEGNDKIPYGSIIIKTDASGDTSKICLNVSNAEVLQKDIEISSYEESTVSGYASGQSADIHAETGEFTATDFPICKGEDLDIKCEPYLLPSLLRILLLCLGCLLDIWLLCNS